MYKKVSVILLLMLLVLPLTFAQVDISKTYPDMIKAGETTQAIVTVTAHTSADNLELIELTPRGWLITGWEIENYNKVNTFYETRDYTHENTQWTLSRWVFSKPVEGTITIFYEITPEKTGNFETRTQWNYEGGSDSLTVLLNVNPSATPDTAVQPKFPSQMPLIKLSGFTIDLTALAVATIICGFAIAGILLVIMSSKEVLRIIEKIKRTSQGKEIMSNPVAIADLRAFIKLGLRRGYTLREMVNELRAGNIETTYFNEIAKEEMIKEMDIQARQKESSEMDSEYIKRLKQIIKNLKKGKA